MDIGLFCDTYPLELDGVGMVVKHYASGLRKMGHRCCMVAPEAAEGYENGEPPCKLLQYRGFTLPVARQYRAGLPSIDFQYLYQRRGVTMDLLHAHSPFGSGMEAVRLARILDVPLIGTFHSKFYDDFYDATRSQTLSIAGVKLILNFFRACDEVWTVNASTEKVLREYGYHGKVVVMPNGSDAIAPTKEEEARAREAYHIGKGVPVFLFVGQQHWKKNIAYILEAVRLYAAAGRNFRMVMVGQGPHAEEIKARVAEWGLANKFIFTGQIMDRALLRGIYAAADLLLFPSLYDTAGLVVQEAAAANTPALLVEGSCAAECVRDGENGFLCADDPDGMAALLLRVTEGEDLLRRAGQEAARTIPLPWDAVLSRVEQRYETLRRQYDMRAIQV